MKYKAIIFDMDGTIIKSEQLWKDATTHTLKRRNVTISEEVSVMIETEFTGRDMRTVCTIIKERFNLTEHVDDLIIEKAATALKLVAHHVIFMEGFADFHKKITTLGLPTALATNAQSAFVHATDAKLNLKQFFGEHIYHINHVNNIGKPNPDIYLHAAKMLGIDPKECIAIEDSAAGLKAARTAGMYCIGFDEIGRPDQMHEAHLVVNKYEEIDLRILHE